MQIRGLNLNSLLVFSSVYRNLSMTLAAQDLGMTQPGVTQHIKNLESLLNAQLFHRVGKRLMPSKEAETIYEGLTQSLENIETLLSGVSQKDRQFIGKVRIGVPIEFGNTMILPHLYQIREKFPEVQFLITYGLPHELNSLILEGKLDFAFIDQYQLNPAIKTEVVFHENLILCCSKDYLQSLKPQKKEKSFFESLSYVEYQQGESLLRNWFERAYGFRKMNISVAAYCFDVQGIATLITHSMGVGILPEHVFFKMRDNGVALHQFKSKEGVINNPISLAYLEQQWSVPLNHYVITTLKETLKSK